MENLVALLICLPFLMALLPACIKKSKPRALAVYICGAIVTVLSVFTAGSWFANGGTAVTFDLPYREVWDKVILLGDFLLMFLIIYLCVKYNKVIISLLSIVQTLAVACLELFGPEVEETPAMRFDYLTFIMVLIIGIIGVAIGVYAVGYMHGYHIHHFKNLKDRRSFFLAMIFVFYGAMFGLVTSASVVWIYFFWEITSVTSFLLIGYTHKEEAINNSFKALWMNLLGGCGIAIAIGYGILAMGTTDLYVMIDAAKGQTTGAVLVPIVFLAFAALTKSAQCPFSGWLLGAMVAPTPSSALLHSATMVKAGVYLLIRISIAMHGNYVGQMVYLVGGFTFFASSCLAIAQSDGKKVLAYSTISNLGLIVACTGIGVEETTWAAVFLLIFHAVSKSMLFQCVGAIENTTGSRDIESMEGLATRFPKLAAILMIGIAGMFLAPFGMLISKWAALKAFIDAPSAPMVLFVCFGSSTTMFYWTKWFAKILGASKPGGRDLTKKNEYISMFFHAAVLVLLCLCFPLVSKEVVLPLLAEIYGSGVSPVISQGNLIIMIAMIVAIIVVPTGCFLASRKINYINALAYMGGANYGDNEHFVDSLGRKKELVVSNWYLEDWFSEKKLFMPCALVGTMLVLVFISLVIGGAF